MALNQSSELSLTTLASCLESFIVDDKLNSRQDRYKRVYILNPHLQRQLQTIPKRHYSPKSNTL